MEEFQLFSYEFWTGMAGGSSSAYLGSKMMKVGAKISNFIHAVNGIWMFFVAVYMFFKFFVVNKYGRILFGLILIITAIFFLTGCSKPLVTSHFVSDQVIESEFREPCGKDLKLAESIFIKDNSVCNYSLNEMVIDENSYKDIFLKDENLLMCRAFVIARYKQWLDYESATQLSKSCALVFSNYKRKFWWEFITDRNRLKSEWLDRSFTSIATKNEKGE